MDEREIFIKAGVWRMVHELGFEEAYRRLKGESEPPAPAPCSSGLHPAAQTPTEGVDSSRSNPT